MQMGTIINRFSAKRISSGVVQIPGDAAQRCHTNIGRCRTKEGATGMKKVIIAVALATLLCISLLGFKFQENGPALVEETPASEQAEQQSSALENPDSSSNEDPVAEGSDWSVSNSAYIQSQHHSKHGTQTPQSHHQQYSEGSGWKHHSE